MQIKKIIGIRKLRKEKIKASLLGASKALMISSPNLNAEQALALRNNVWNLGGRLEMTLKRMAHKLFLGDRKNNEKTEFKNNLYLVHITDNIDMAKLWRAFRQSKSIIEGLITNGSMIKDFIPYQYCNFNKDTMLQLCVKALLMPQLVALNNLEKFYNAK